MPDFCPGICCRDEKKNMRLVLGLTVVILLTCWIDFGSVDAAEGFANSYFMEIEGINLHYRIWEPEEVSGNLLLVHGFSGSTFSWRDVVDPLKREGFRVIAVDLPGFGLSQKINGIDYTRQGMALTLIDFWEELGFHESLHLIGHSMGGSVVLQMACDRSELFSSVVLITPALDGGGGNTFLSSLMGFSPLERILEFFVSVFFINERRVTQTLTDLYRRPPTPEELDGYLTPLQDDHAARALIRMAGQKAKEPGFAKETGADFTLPVLAIFGQEDPWIDYERGLDFLKSFPQKQIYILEGAGHLPQETHAGKFLDLFLGFLQEVFP